MLYTNVTAIEEYSSNLILTIIRVSENWPTSLHNFLLKYSNTVFIAIDPNCIC